MTESTAVDALPQAFPPATAGSRRSRSRVLVGLICTACVLFLVGATSMAEAPLDGADVIKAVAVLVFVVSMTFLAFRVIRRDLRA